MYEDFCIKIDVVIEIVFIGGVIIYKFLMLYSLFV